MLKGHMEIQAPPYGCLGHLGALGADRCLSFNFFLPISILTSNKNIPLLYFLIFWENPSLSISLII